MTKTYLGTKENQEEILSILAGVNFKMGSQDATLKKIQTGVGVIKSIQRGSSSIILNKTNTSGHKQIYINSINKNKSFVILNFDGIYTSSGYQLRNCRGGGYLGSLSNNSISVYLYTDNENTFDVTVNFSWQVIEFY